MSEQAPPRPQAVSAALGRAGLDSASRGLSGYRVSESYVPAGARVTYVSRVQVTGQRRMAMLMLYLRTLREDGYDGMLNPDCNALLITERRS